MFCVILFHNAHNDVFFARLLKVIKNLTLLSLNFQSGEMTACHANCIEAIRRNDQLPFRVIK